MDVIHALIVSSALSWLFNLALILAVWALARQIGLLHERIRPVGALSLGKTIKAGEVAPGFTLPSLTGGSVSLGGANGQGQSTLLFFLSETCPVCKALLPVLKAIRQQEHSRLRVVLASDGEVGAHQTFIEAQRLQEFPYVLSQEVGLAYQISKLPYGVLIDASGTVVTHGLINTREHLESLFEAQDIGFASIQAFEAARHVVEHPLYKKVH
ncbi:MULTISPECIES: methylamine dehydrogenase accessory protein MauD [unclassified Pseudomonas]|uniref:methylamine dehydrogenase accessory protein MauD n=1 Tax=unclassified Pseudomonas TaxID=196821 RepID=UPI000C8831A2|nr:MULTISPECIES: methylamine dehydrogenase accessory protein MauD [unclassified Pseudomonas]PMZ73238.1 methylamine dehydrogenase accessory protein MauD [Pseudomonas sp. GW247-3R2A]PMY73368.1 methylamine dehydrogenase accessory protein MauD [Pseudomonas sp. MPR-R3A]PMY98048.1 methylamine dehydrogenase accessory protein MauD [Pseudomonas sp. FW305-124]PNA92636.1 methylamine dehydrogenase accessory protein MauD [Pseudomonas sp. FW300-E2]PNB03188.1 methylamine dehydrogenase accessory protein MauD 